MHVSIRNLETLVISRDFAAQVYGITDLPLWGRGFEGGVESFTYSGHTRQVLNVSIHYSIYSCNVADILLFQRAKFRKQTFKLLLSFRGLNSFII